MTDYRAPLQDIEFLLKNVFDVPHYWARWPKLAELVDGDTASAVLEEAGKLVAGSVAPLNRNADEQGSRWDQGKVTTPDGFKEAYRQYAQSGWVGVTGDPAYGGMGMPKVIGALVEEMVNSSSLAFGLFPMLTSGACVAINAHASDELKEKYLPNMYSGQWAGSMCLTEAHAGTDLGLIRTRAEPQDDGSYRITGGKIFITGGEQDLTENIIHLVLAKLPDAPAGSRGISLFLVPKFLVNEDGSLGERNGVACGSIEHKMGIHGSPTCVMNFDGAKGWLVGEPNRGLAAMFTMMNYERLGVGVQGLSAAERSWQTALQYARERLQSRAPGGPTAPDKAADPIIEQPDVRRMLLTMKAFNEASRAFSTYIALQLDIAKFSDDQDERQRANALVALLTPVAKAFITDVSLECTLHGQIILGGHGYVREWGQEQLVRDVRITQIYEGTNGIQSLDLAGRKVVGNKGAYVELFTDEITQFIDGADAQLAEFTRPLADAVARLKSVTQWLLEQASAQPREIGAASVEYLHLFGYTAYAYMWVRMAAAALAQGNEFSRIKLATARFFFARLLPRTLSCEAAVRAGGESLYLLQQEQF